MATSNGSSQNGHQSTVPLGRYLWERIKQVGISHVHGVPGDFNLTLLDHIYPTEGLDWVGNSNELNAAYAADAYGRVKGAGCVVTTHGVGELSALNAIAGAMTEQVKVVHVVGQTSRKMQQGHMMIHHSIGFQPDHQCFNHASRAFRVAAAELQHAEGAAEEIDRVLREMFVQSRPVYIFVPIDLVEAPVSAERLKTPINLEAEIDQKAVEEAAEVIMKTLSASKNPGIFIDCLVQRRQAVQEVRQLVNQLKIPFYTSNMGKGIVDETNEYYAGLANGYPSGAGVQKAFESHDTVLTLGILPCDTNTGGFSRKFPENTIYVNTDDVQTKDWKSSSPHLPLKALLSRLNKIAPSYKLADVENPKDSYPAEPAHGDEEDKEIRQSWIWKRVAAWLQPHDVVFGETGTAAFGIPDSTFPSDIHWITQTYYGSIGYATPAAFGADLALRDLASQNIQPRGRTVLVSGDGSMMLTVQEIGNMVKHKLCPVILLINNAGYTIERVIHGARCTYNDIVPFNYEHMLPFFNMPIEEARKSFHKATTKVELDAILEKDSVKNPKTVQVVEIVMDTFDVPWRLATGVGMRGAEAVKEMKEAGFKVRDMDFNSSFWN